MNAMGLRPSEKLFVVGGRLFAAGVVAMFLGILPPVHAAVPQLAWIGFVVAFLGGMGMVVGYRPRK